jgi:hypothetical protein
MMKALKMEKVVESVAVAAHLVTAILQRLSADDEDIAAAIASCRGNDVEFVMTVVPYLRQLAEVALREALYEVVVEENLKNNPTTDKSSAYEAASEAVAESVSESVAAETNGDVDDASLSIEVGPKNSNDALAELIASLTADLPVFLTLCQQLISDRRGTDNEIDKLRKKIRELDKRFCTFE